MNCCRTIGTVLSVVSLLAGSSPAAIASPPDLFQGDAIATAFPTTRIKEREWQFVPGNGRDKILYINLPSTSMQLGYAYERAIGNADEAGQMQHRLWWLGSKSLRADYPDLQGLAVVSRTDRESDKLATAKHLLLSTKIGIWRTAKAGGNTTLDLREGVALVDHCLRLTTGEILTDQRIRYGGKWVAEKELASLLSHPAFRRVRRALVKSNSVSPLIRATFLALGRPSWAPQHRKKPLWQLKPGLNLSDTRARPRSQQPH